MEKKNGVEGNKTVTVVDGKKVLNGGDGKNMVNGSEGKKMVNGCEGKKMLNGGDGKKLSNGSDGKKLSTGAEGRKVSSAVENRKVVTTPSKKTSTIKKRVEWSDKFAQECLEAHNQLRERHRTPPLTLSKKVIIFIFYVTSSDLYSNRTDMVILME